MDALGHALKKLRASKRSARKNSANTEFTTYQDRGFWFAEARDKHGMKHLGGGIKLADAKMRCQEKLDR